MTKRSFGFDFGQLEGRSLVDQVQLLGDYIIELEELYLSTLSTGSKFLGGDFTPSEEAIAASFVQCSGVLRKDFLAQLLYGGRAEADQPKDATQDIRQFVSRLRKKFKPYAIEIMTIHGVGWSIDEHSMTKLRLLYKTPLGNNHNEPFRDSQSSFPPKYRTFPSDGTSL